MLTRLKYLIPVLATLALPSAADAATVKVNISSSNVNSSACGVGAQTPCKTIQLGATRAQGLAGADQIVVAPGTYTSLVTVPGSGDSIAGAGSCDQAATCTIIQPAPGANDAVAFPVTNDGASISGVRIKAATSVSRNGLLFEGDDPTVRDVVIDMAAPANTKAALRLSGAGDAVVDRTTVLTDGEGEGIFALGLMDSLTLTDSTVRTTSDFPLFLAAVGTTTVRRSKIEEVQAPGGTNSLVAADETGPVRIESSLLLGGLIGLNLGAPATVVGSTIDPGARGGNDGVTITTEPADAGEVSTARDSLLIGAQYTNAGQQLSCSTSVVGANLGNNAPSCVAGAAGNLATAPTDLFANVGATDYRLKAGSPAVDSGSAAALDPAETTDLAGNARVLDGNGDCAARRDRGAYELTGFAAGCPQGQGGGVTPPPADTRKPVVSRFNAGRTRLMFRLSEAARVSVRVERRAGKARTTVHRRVGTFSVRKVRAGANRVKLPAGLAKKLRRPATYRVTLVATDAAGNRSKAVRKSFRVKASRKQRRARA